MDCAVWLVIGQGWDAFMVLVACWWVQWMLKDNFVFPSAFDREGLVVNLWSQGMARSLEYDFVFFPEICMIGSEG